MPVVCDWDACFDVDALLDRYVEARLEHELSSHNAASGVGAGAHRDDDPERYFFRLEFKFVAGQRFLRVKKVRKISPRGETSKSQVWGLSFGLRRQHREVEKHGRARWLTTAEVETARIPKSGERPTSSGNNLG